MEQRLRWIHSLVFDDENFSYHFLVETKTNDMKGIAVVYDDEGSLPEDTNRNSKYEYHRRA